MIIDHNLEVYHVVTKSAEKENPNAIRVIKEIRKGLSSNYNKDVEKFVDPSFDYVITVWDNAEETCPIFIGNFGKQLQIGLIEPAEAIGKEEKILSAFRKVENEIRKDFNNFYL